MILVVFDNVLFLSWARMLILLKHNSSVCTFISFLILENRWAKLPLVILFLKPAAIFVKGSILLAKSLKIWEVQGMNNHEKTEKLWLDKAFEMRI